MRKVCSLFFSLCVLGLVGAGNVCAITITINDSSAPGNTSYRKQRVFLRKIIPLFRSFLFALHRSLPFLSININRIAFDSLWE